MNQAATRLKEAEKPRDVVVECREKYSDALELANVSAEHTATVGWQALYTEAIDGFRQRREHMAQALNELAEQLKEGHLGEEGEKSIGDVKKQAAELRIEQQVFEAKTVWPVREPVDVCEKIISDALFTAADLTSRFPLPNAGLEDRMAEEVKTWPRATWDRRRGIVTVGEEVAANKR